MTLFVGIVALLSEIMSEQVSGCVTLVLHAGEHQWCKEQDNDEQFSTQSIYVTVVYFCTKMPPAGFK